MTRFGQIVLVTSALMLPLGGCASIGDALDPTDWFSGDLFNTKKKLPGDRKPVFPEGVPGVAQGIPPDLVKGNQPPPESGFAGTDTQSVGSTPRQAAAKTDEYQPAPREKAKPKPKPKPATAERQPPAQERAKERAQERQPAKERQPTSVTVRRAPEAQPQQQQQQQQQSGSATQWPDPPAPSRSGAQSGGVQWPDPPTLR